MSVPAGLGGAPGLGSGGSVSESSPTANLWLELPAAVGAPYGPRARLAAAAFARHLVCDESFSLARAQRMFAENWTAFVTTYGAKRVMAYAPASGV
jgi:hypothetical protein